MKKSLLLIATAVLGCMAMISCNDKPDDNDSPPRDESLAGSLDSGLCYVSVEGSYDNKPIENNNETNSLIMMFKISDTEIKLGCDFRCDGKSSRILIYDLPLSGVPYNVTFDHSVSDLILRIEDTRYYGGAITCKGWIKSQELDIDNNISSRSLPPMRLYSCEMDINGVIDGKELHMKITNFDH